MRAADDHALVPTLKALRAGGATLRCRALRGVSIDKGGITAETTDPRRT